MSRVHTAGRPGPGGNAPDRTHLSRSALVAVAGVRAPGLVKRMRAQGMRRIQMWVADVRAPGSAREAHRQSAAVAASDHAADDQAFIDAVSLDEA